jgi:hypothetical protein
VERSTYFILGHSTIVQYAGFIWSFNPRFGTLCNCPTWHQEVGVSHTWIWVESQGGGGVVSNFDGFSRAYVVKIRPSAEFLEGGGLPKILGGGHPPSLNPCMVFLQGTPESPSGFL